MTKIITFFNQAGGVGKTTTTINVGYHLAKKNHRVLLVDMDPQASLTNFMGLEPEELENTIHDLIMEHKGIDVQDVLLPKIHLMDLLPSNIDLAQAEHELLMADLREFRLKEALEPIIDDYDFILIDCPPSLGLLSFISLVTANYVLVPVQCQFKSLKSTDYLLKTVARVRKRLNRDLKIAAFLPTMYQTSNSMDKRTLETIEENLEKIAPVLPPLNRATAIAEASESGEPLALSSKKHRKSLKLFDLLATKLEELS